MLKPCGSQPILTQSHPWKQESGPAPRQEAKRRFLEQDSRPRRKLETFPVLDPAGSGRPTLMGQILWAITSSLYPIIQLLKTLFRLKKLSSNLSRSKKVNKRNKRKFQKILNLYYWQQISKNYLPVIIKTGRK